MPPPDSSYDPFARMYDRHWGTKSLRRVDRLEELVLRRLPMPARILDLCCGTGQLARVLTERGHVVLGLDISEGMLDHARTNAPAARFVLGDARNFRADEEFNAVVCMFDSLNHLMRESDLASAFGSVADALHPGGIFAFDLNMEVKYLETWSGEFSVIGAHEVALVRAGVEPETKRGVFDATVFYDEGDGRWSRHEVHLVQTWYGEERVARLLMDAGFATPTTHGMQPMPDDPKRAQNLLFVTTKTP